MSKTHPSTRKSYRVTWEIDIYAKSPRAAAKEALRIQRDPQSHATMFYVQEPDGNNLVIDAVTTKEKS
jgi:hypothetical protein